MIPLPHLILDSTLVNAPSLYLAPLHCRRLRFKLMLLLVHLLPRYDRVLVILIDHQMLLWPSGKWGTAGFARRSL